MSDGFFAGLLLVTTLIVLGIQGWHIVGLALEGEIGWPRAAVLFAVIAIVAVFAGANFASSGAIPLPLPVTMLLLASPVIALQITRFWEEKFWHAKEAEMIRQEISGWKYTLRQDPEHRGAWIRLGDLHRKLGETEKALECYRQALELKPGDPQIEDRIMFLEKKMETLPRFTETDKQAIREELKRIPVISLWVLGAVFAFGLLIFLFHYLPMPVAFLLCLLVPTVLFMRWILKQ